MTGQVDLSYTDQLFRHLATSEIDGGRIEVQAGLTVHELQQAQARYGFHFPPDLAELLSIALPVSLNPRGWGFPNWRAPDERLDEQVRAPTEDLIAAAGRGFWLPAWGRKPSSAAKGADQLRTLLAAAPRLIPVFSHRYLADRPLAAGNPVFSVAGVDVIIFGNDLSDYFATEFKAPPRPWPKQTTTFVDFWSPLVDALNQPIR